MDSNTRLSPLLPTELLFLMVRSPEIVDITAHKEKSGTAYRSLAAYTDQQGFFPKVRRNRKKHGSLANLHNPPPEARSTKISKVYFVFGFKTVESLCPFARLFTNKSISTMLILVGTKLLGFESHDNCYLVFTNNDQLWLG